MIYSYFQISAQESRRKKKEFVDTLERKVDVAVQDLEDYKKKCELLQKQNTSLRSQLKSLRSILANNNSMSQSTTIKPDPDCKSIFLLHSVLGSNTHPAKIDLNKKWLPKQKTI